MPSLCHFNPVAILRAAVYTMTVKSKKSICSMFCIKFNASTSRRVVLSWKRNASFIKAANGRKAVRSGLDISGIKYAQRTSRLRARKRWRISASKIAGFPHVLDSLNCSKAAWQLSEGGPGRNTSLIVVAKSILGLPRFPPLTRRRALALPTSATSRAALLINSYFSV